MNIQQYITTEMLLSLVVVGTMAFVYLCFRLSGRLQNQVRDYNTDNNLPQFAPDIRAGDIWYTRTGDYEPYINKEVEPIRILEYRVNGYDGWVKYELDGSSVVKRFSEFVINHMTDEFNDIIQLAEPVKEDELELLLEFEEPEVAVTVDVPSRNIVSIDGRDYVLAPV
jgi:hypothetical protein